MRTTDRAADAAVGRLIRGYREQRRISQETLARRVDVSWKTVARWELGRSAISAVKPARVAGELGIGLLDLLPPRVTEDSSDKVS